MKFALIGAAGYIAPRHIQAIKDTNNDLVAALDPHDSVGILDRYFHDVDFFTEFERFDRHIDKLKRSNDPINYVSICSPNYLHDAHIRFALRSNADAICEKPLVLNSWNLDSLKEIEEETGKHIYTILQLREHKAIIDLKEKYAHSNKVHNVYLKYITPRGPWYHYSWKGDESKSGGIVTNIGIHFFDMLIWIFGDVININVDMIDQYKAMGELTLQKAHINWFLSTDINDLPQGTSSMRSIEIDGEQVDFTKGFTDLHTQSYNSILNGHGFGIEDARASIELVHKIKIEDNIR